MTTNQDLVRELIKEKEDMYISQMEGAGGDDFLKSEWAAGAMRQLLREYDALKAHNETKKDES